MTDNDKRIITDLSDWVDYGDDNGYLLSEILDLINRQKEQIEALIAGQETLQKALNEKIADNERLKKLLDDEEKKFKLCAKRYYAIGVKDFVERLEPLKRSRSLLYESDYELSVTMRQVDKVKKEMVGEG